MTKARRPPAGPDIEPICDQVTGRVYRTVETWDAATEAQRNGATVEEPDVGEPALGLEESEPATEEVSPPTVDAEPSGIPKPKGKGKRAPHRSWNISLAEQESLLLMKHLRAHKQPIPPTEIRIGASFDDTFGETAEIIALPPPAVAALAVLHPSVLYRLLSLDGLTPAGLLVQLRALEATQDRASRRISPPRAVERAEMRAAHAQRRGLADDVQHLNENMVHLSEVSEIEVHPDDVEDNRPQPPTNSVRRARTSSMLAGALAATRLGALRDFQLATEPARVPDGDAQPKRDERARHARARAITNNKSGEIAVIDVRLALLHERLQWSPGRIGELIIQSCAVWAPAPCPGRVGRWNAAALASAAAEKWVQKRLRVAKLASGN